MTKPKSIQHQHLNSNNMVTSDAISNSPLQRYVQKIQVLKESHEKSFSQHAQKTTLYESSSLKLMQDLSKRHQTNKNKSKRAKRPQTNTTNAPSQKKRVKKASITASSASGLDGNSVSVSENNAFEGDLFDNFSVDDICGPLPDLEVNDIENVLAMFDAGQEMKPNHSPVGSKDNVPLVNHSSEPYFPPPDLFEVPTQQNGNSELPWQENVPYTVANSAMSSQNVAIKHEDSNYPQYSSDSNLQQDNLHLSWQQQSVNKLEMLAPNSQENIRHTMPYFTNYNQYNSMQSQQKSFSHGNKTLAYYENQNMNPSMNRQLYSAYPGGPGQQSFNNHSLSGHLDTGPQNMGQSSHESVYQRQYTAPVQESFHHHTGPGSQMSMHHPMSHHQSVMMSSVMTMPHNPSSSSLYSHYPVGPSQTLTRHANYPGSLM